VNAFKKAEARAALQLMALRSEARELESQLRGKRGNRELIKRELFAVRSIIIEVTS
jgi:hypothetical protein